MPQGWKIDATADLITFSEQPTVGTNNITVKEYAAGGAGSGATDVWALGAFSDAFGYPAEVEYFADRLFFAATRTQPQTIWASRIGDYRNFSRSVPIADDDSFSFTINARRLNAIRDLCALDNLLPLTLGTEWRMTAGADEVVTPSTVGFKPQSWFGASKLPALIIGASAVFVQEKGQLIRDLSYSFAAGESGGYEPTDLTKYCRHLVLNRLLVDATYAQAPFSIAHYVRDDGLMLAMTYDREEAVIAFAPQETAGWYESVCCVPEGKEHAVYVAVRRIVNGQEVRYTERFASRLPEDPLDEFHVDCGLTYDGRNTTATTLTLSGGTAWDSTEILTCTASAALFVGASDEDDHLYLHADAIEADADGIPRTVRRTVRVEIVDYSSATVVSVRPLGEVPAELQGVATATWTFARRTISGLDHLEGWEVAVVADAAVEPRKVVTDGEITLDRPGGVVHVGIPYKAVGLTLPLNMPGAESVRPRVKLISKAYLQVENTPGLKAGVSLDNLYEAKVREEEDYDEVTQRVTGLLEIGLDARWDRNGQFYFVADEPVPAKVLALIPDIEVGGSP